MELNRQDVVDCIEKLPIKVRRLIEENGEGIILAGGYIRAIIQREEIKDIDLFVKGKITARIFAQQMAVDKYDIFDYIETDNAITVKNLSIPVQFVYNRIYANPLDIIKSFDFTVCQAMIWYDQESSLWLSQCSDSFYPDLEAKRITYLSPIRDEDAGGSMLRVLKYYKKGYTIPLNSLGAVLSRLFISVQKRNDGIVKDEKEIAKSISGFLFQADPSSLLSLSRNKVEEQEKQEEYELSIEP